MAYSFAESVVVRSISLPSRLNSNSGNLLHFEAELRKLKSWESSSSSSSWSVQLGLVRLAELYNCMAEAIQSPQTQQALRKNQQAIIIEEALEGSVMLLDSWGIARDIVLMMREQVQDLQSLLRRRQVKDSSINTKIHAYICFRRKAKKDVAKCLRSLKKMENDIGSSLEHDAVMVLKWLREVNAIAISVFRSLMVILSEPVVGGWSMVRRLMPKSGGEQSVNEIGGLDLALQCLCKKNGGKFEVEKVKERLERVDASMKGLEDGLDCSFRSLIHNRVALLNVLTM